jgi:hypothetical protein
MGLNVPGNQWSCVFAAVRPRKCWNCASNSCLFQLLQESVGILPYLKFFFSSCRQMLTFSNKLYLSEFFQANFAVLPQIRICFSSCWKMSELCLKFAFFFFFFRQMREFCLNLYFVVHPGECWKRTKKFIFFFSFCRQ